MAITRKLDNDEEQHEREQVQPKTRKIILIISTALVVLGILTAFGMHYTSQPGFCTSCHEINPQVKSWSLGPHKNITCLNCHSNPGTVGYISRKIGGLHEVYLHATGQVPQQIQANEQTIVAACTHCHTGQAKEFPNAKNLTLTSGSLAPKVSHAAVLANKTTCLLCHRNVGHVQSPNQTPPNQ